MCDDQQGADDTSNAPPKGTSLMEALYSDQVVGAIRAYTCSECGIKVDCPVVDTDLTFFRPMGTRRWKYCPGCGREIARFAEHPERKRRRLAAKS